MKRRIAGAEKIKAGMEYYDEVHYKWVPVPTFWYGDRADSHTFLIALFEN